MVQKKESTAEIIGGIVAFVVVVCLIIVICVYCGDKSDDGEYVEEVYIDGDGHHEEVVEEVIVEETVEY